MNKQHWFLPFSIVTGLLIFGSFSLNAYAFQQINLDLDPNVAQGFCGDGKVVGDEECDDSNSLNTDSCLNDCTAASCGDGFVQAGVEECDDGNTANGDGCSSTCVVEQSSFNPVLITDFVFDIVDYSDLTGNIAADSGLSFPTEGPGDIIDTLGTGDFIFPEYIIETEEEECTTEPCDDPPSGDVIPNFSGLVVQGATELYGSLMMDPENDDDPNVLIDTDGNIKFSDPEGEQSLKLMNFLNISELKSSGLALIDSPWIILETGTLDIQSTHHGDLVVNVDGYLNAKRIGSFYSKYTTYSTGGGGLSSDYNALATPTCDRAGEYAVSYWHNITNYNSSIPNFSLLGVERIFDENVPIGYTLRIVNKFTAATQIQVGVTCFNAQGYRPVGGEVEV
ncbi:DUF4215 domain-containing protein [Candidatus Peregrinibacteria bacterium]|nr:DUF4215 domain-containing protein [Candidatus Peregrinibacteria bacterium]